jgi:hypothetical protein
MRYLFESNGWSIDISLLRKPFPIDKKSLGYVHYGAREINTSKPLLTALQDKKPNKYQLGNLPYVICLSSDDTFLKDHCLSEVLFGQPTVNEIALDYVYKDGFYFANKKIVNTRVSAVIFFRHFNTFTLDHSVISVWHNPFAKTPIPHNSLLFDEYYFERVESTLKQKEYNKCLDILKILEIDREKYVKWKDKSIG